MRAGLFIRAFSGEFARGEEVWLWETMGNRGNGFIGF